MTTPERAHIRVIAPSSSAATVDAGVRARAVELLESAGCSVSWGANAFEVDLIGSSSVDARCEDLHEAFADPEVDIVLAVRGGFSSSQLLPHLDWDLIGRSRAVLCGFSDITALCGGFLTRTGRWSVLGPVLASIGSTADPEAMIAGVLAATTAPEPPVLRAPGWWRDEPATGPDRQPGRWRVRNPDRVSGQVIGGNLSTWSLLHGTGFGPRLNGAIAVIEEDSLSDAVTFDRLLGSLCQQPGADELAGIVVGRLQPSGPISVEELDWILDQHPVIAGLPGLVDADLSHTDPVLPVRIGWRYELIAESTDPRLEPLGAP